jgi:hypothetical protein
MDRRKLMPYDLANQSYTCGKFGVQTLFVMDVLKIDVTSDQLGECLLVNDVCSSYLGS